MTMAPALSARSDNSSRGSSRYEFRSSSTTLTSTARSPEAPVLRLISIRRFDEAMVAGTAVDGIVSVGFAVLLARRDNACVKFLPTAAWFQYSYPSPGRKQQRHRGPHLITTRPAAESSPRLADFRSRPDMGVEFGVAASMNVHP